MKILSKSFYKQNIFLIITFILGFFLRTFQLDQIPTILNRDEAGLGYNAFLLKETGKDEWGNSWPLALKSFGDYKLVGYPIFIIGSFFIFGINDFAVRFPSALAGSLLILVAYFFGKRTDLSKNQSLLFALSIAITPVFLFYSRIGFEANLALTMIATILLMAFSKNISVRQDILILVLFAFSLFTYNTPLILAPFIMTLFILKRGVRQPKKWLFLLISMICLWFFSIFKLMPLSAQKSGITIINDDTTWAKYIDYRNIFSGFSKNLIGNKYIFYLSIIFKNYVKSFTPSFLVFKGGIHPWHALPNFGHIYFTSYLLAIFGLASALINSARIFSKRISKKLNHLYLFIFLFISLLPSVVTVDSPHATRSLLFFYLLLYFSIYFFSLVKKKISIITTVVFLCLLSLESTNYFYNYFIKYPDQQPDSLKRGFSEFINKIDQEYQDKNIAVVDEEGFQYILTSWYLKIPPQEYFSTISMQLPNSIGFNYGEKVANYHFIVDKNDRIEEEKILLEYNDTWKYTEF